MATYFWGEAPGVSGDFADAGNWFDTATQLFGVGVPGDADTANVVGATPQPPLHPIPVHIVVAQGQTATVSRLQVLFQSHDEDFVWIEGSLRVVDEILFENDRGNLRLIGTLTLDGTTDGATMDVDYLHVGGSPVTSARNVVSVDDDGMFRVVGNARVTTRHLEVLGRGGLAVSGGGTVDVAGPVVLQQSAGGTPVLIDGPNSRLEIHGTSSYGLDISELGSLSIKNGGTVDVTGKVVIHQDDLAPVVSVDGQGSALLVDGNLSLDGYLTFTQGARGTAKTVTVNSTSPTSLIVGDLTGNNIFSLFTATDMTLGDGLGGFGNLVALPNGQIVVKETLTLQNPITNATTFSGTLATFGGSIEIGGHTGAALNTIQIDLAGLAVGLLGHGMVQTGTLQNDGFVGARGGLLYVDANVAGKGYFLVDSESALEIDGKFASAGTVALTGSFSTVILDEPELFSGLISALDPGDTIQLNKAGSALGNAVRSAVITVGSNGEQLLTLIQDNALFPLHLRISGTSSLARSRFSITESADHTSTLLTLTDHGTTTIYDLNSSGQIVLESVWGDGQGSVQTKVYRDSLGRFVDPVASPAYASNHMLVDLTNQQVNRVEHFHLDSLGQTISSVFRSTLQLAPLASKILQWLPNPADAGLSGSHNFLNALRVPAWFDYSYTDGSGNSMTQSVVNGLATVYNAFQILTGSSSASLAMDGVIAGPAALPGPSGNSVDQRFVAGGLLDFYSIRQPDGDVERYTKLQDGTYSVQVIDGFDGKAHSVGTVTPVTLVQRIIASHQYIGTLGQPLAGIGADGELLQNSLATLVDANGVPLIGLDGASLQGLDGAGVPTGGGGTLVPKTVATLIGLDGASLIGLDGASLIGLDGASLVQALAGVVSRTAKIGVPDEVASVVSAGVASAFGTSGKAAPGRYLSDALVIADANGDGQLNNGEAWSFTDAEGHFELSGGLGTLVLTGGTDSGTHIPFVGTLTAPVGSTSVSALTTLASGLAQGTGNIDGAIAQVQAALGIDGKIDFTVIDPIASTENGDAASAKIYVEMSKTMDAVLLIGAAFAGLGADQSKAQQAAFDAMVGAINKTGTLDLSDKATVDGLIVAVGGALGSSAGTIVGALSGSITSTSLLLDKLLVQEGSGTDLTSGITMIETAVQGALVSSLKASGGDPGKLGPAPLLLQATSDDGKSTVTPGHVVTITLTTSEAVTVTGAPTLLLSNGKAATFFGGSGSALIFKYAAQAGDGAGDLDVASLSLGSGGSIKDTSGNALAGTVAGDLGLALDAGALVAVSALDAAKAEGNGGGATSYTFSVTRTGDTSVADSVSWSVSGSGKFGAGPQDFAGSALNGGTVTFAAGETSKTITIDVVADSEVEPDEEFLVSLAAPSAGLAIGTGSAAGSIHNDDATVSIAAQSSAQVEGTGGQTAFAFTLAMRGDLSVAHSFIYTVTGSGAVPAVAGDFVVPGLTTDSVTFAPGESAGTITVLVIGDTAVEADEGFTVTLSNPSPGLLFGVASAATTIQNDDGSVISISAQSAAKAEQNGGTTPFTFTVTIGQAATIVQSVDWAVTGTGDDAADGADFADGVLPSGTLTFAPGQISKTFTVPVAGDTAVEFDDFFTVTLSNPSAGASLGTASALGIIQNDDRTSVSIAPLSAVGPEGNSGTASFTFTVSLDQASTAEQSAGWAVTGSGINAANAGDFGGALPSGTVTFAAGETSKIVTVPVSGDATVEFNEDFTVTLSNLSFGLALGAATATGTIQNDDRPAVSITGGAATHVEGSGGTTAYDFTVSLDRAAITLQSVAWAVTGASVQPVDAADFGGSLPSGTLTFAPGEASKIVTLTVSGDTLVEFDEGLVLTLSTPSSGLDLGTATRSGTIANDDRSTVSIAALSAAKAEGNSGTTPFTFTVSLDQPSVVGQSISWAVAGSGATPANASDFAGGVLPAGTVTFAAGETTKTLTVGVTSDSSVEPAEGFAVTLSSPTSGLTLGTAAATGTIQNDDAAAVVSVHGDAYIVHEGHALTVPVATGLLANDQNASTASLISGPAHGSLQIVGNGSFSYTPAAGFTGIDSFTYQAGNTGSSMANEQAAVYVVPVNVGATTTLDLLGLTAREQIAATYAAFFGRGADALGFEFWVGEFNRGLPTQGAAALFANIASSFGISGEARALYPFLVNPFGASDGQISAFLDSVYNNLFNRSSDALGLAYWTGQIKATLQAGQFVGSILVNIMSGAQDTDITTLMGKVAVSLAFVTEQEEHHKAWVGASDSAAATTLLQAVTADPQTVLVGVRNAETLIAAHA